MTTHLLTRFADGETERVPWDDDMVVLLVGMQERHMTYRGMADALSVFLGFEVTTYAVEHKLRLLGLTNGQGKRPNIQAILGSRGSGSRPMVGA
jgi:hypothetical protein